MFRFSSPRSMVIEIFREAELMFLVLFLKRTKMFRFSGTSPRSRGSASRRSTLLCKRKHTENYALLFNSCNLNQPHTIKPTVTEAGVPEINSGSLRRPGHESCGGCSEKKGGAGGVTPLSRAYK
jgi:hypothetical protein